MVSVRREPGFQGWQRFQVMVRDTQLVLRHPSGGRAGLLLPTWDAAGMSGGHRDSSSTGSSSAFRARKHFVVEIQLSMNTDFQYFLAAESCSSSPGWLLAPQLPVTSSVLV